MTYAFDATFLLYLFREPGTVATPKGEDGKPVQFAKERVEGLVAELQKAGAKIIVGTPALSEIMVRVGVEEGQKYIAIMAKSVCFKICPFDIKAAIETALMHGHAVSGEASKSKTAATHAKLKYDRQIVAIAKAEGAHTLFTDDADQRAFAEKHGLQVRGLSDLTVPTEANQMSLFAAAAGESDDEE